jgi:hypothetical protein
MLINPLPTTNLKIGRRGSNRGRKASNWRRPNWDRWPRKKEKNEKISDEKFLSDHSAVPFRPVEICDSHPLS